MKTYTVTYSFEGAIRIDAETEGEAQRKFEQYSAIDLAYYAADSLKMIDVIPEESEGLAKLSVEEMAGEVVS